MNLYLVREKHDARKLVQISCVDISGSIVKKGYPDILIVPFWYFFFFFFQRSNNLILQHDVLIVQ